MSSTVGSQSDGYGTVAHPNSRRELQRFVPPIRSRSTVCRPEMKKMMYPAIQTSVAKYNLTAHPFSCRPQSTQWVHYRNHSNIATIFEHTNNSRKIFKRKPKQKRPMQVGLNFPNGLEVIVKNTYCECCTHGENFKPVCQCKKKSDDIGTKMPNEALIPLEEQRSKRTTPSCPKSDRKSEKNMVPNEVPIPLEEQRSKRTTSSCPKSDRKSEKFMDSMEELESFAGARSPQRIPSTDFETISSLNSNLGQRGKRKSSIKAKGGKFKSFSLFRSRSSTEASSTGDDVSKKLHRMHRKRQVFHCLNSTSRTENSLTEDILNYEKPAAETVVKKSSPLRNHSRQSSGSNSTIRIKRLLSRSSSEQRTNESDRSAEDKQPRLSLLRRFSSSRKSKQTTRRKSIEGGKRGSRIKQKLSRFFSRERTKGKEKKTKNKKSAKDDKGLEDGKKSVKKSSGFGRLMRTMSTSLKGKKKEPTKRESRSEEVPSRRSKKSGQFRKLLPVSSGETSKSSPFDRSSISRSLSSSKKRLSKSSRKMRETLAKVRPESGTSPSRQTTSPESITSSPVKRLVPRLTLSPAPNSSKSASPKEATFSYGFSQGGKDTSPERRGGSPGDSSSKTSPKSIILDDYKAEFTVPKSPRQVDNAVDQLHKNALELIRLEQAHRLGRIQHNDKPKSDEKSDSPVKKRKVKEASNLTEVAATSATNDDAKGSVAEMPKPPLAETEIQSNKSKRKKSRRSRKSATPIEASAVPTMEASEGIVNVPEPPSTELEIPSKKPRRKKSRKSKSAEQPSAPIAEASEGIANVPEHSESEIPSKKLKRKRSRKSTKTEPPITAGAPSASMVESSEANRKVPESPPAVLEIPLDKSQKTESRKPEKIEFVIPTVSVIPKVEKPEITSKESSDLSEGTTTEVSSSAADQSVGDQNLLAVTKSGRKLPPMPEPLSSIERSEAKTMDPTSSTRVAETENTFRSGPNRASPVPALSLHLQSPTHTDIALGSRAFTETGHPLRDEDTFSQGNKVLLTVSAANVGDINYKKSAGDRVTMNTLVQTPVTLRLSPVETQPVPTIAKDTRDDRSPISSDAAKALATGEQDPRLTLTEGEKSKKKKKEKTAPSTNQPDSKSKRKSKRKSSRSESIKGKSKIGGSLDAGGNVAAMPHEHPVQPEELLHPDEGQISERPQESIRMMDNLMGEITESALVPVPHEVLPGADLEPARSNPVSLEPPEQPIHQKPLTDKQPAGDLLELVKRPDLKRITIQSARPAKSLILSRGSVTKVLNMADRKSDSPENRKESLGAITTQTQTSTPTEPVIAGTVPKRKSKIRKMTKKKGTPSEPTVSEVSSPTTTAHTSQSESRQSHFQLQPNKTLTISWEHSGKGRPELTLRNCVDSQEDTEQSSATRGSMSTTEDQSLNVYLDEKSNESDSPSRAPHSDGSRQCVLCAAHCREVLEQRLPARISPAEREDDLSWAPFGHGLLSHSGSGAVTPKALDLMRLSDRLKEHSVRLMCAEFKEQTRRRLLVKHALAKCMIRELCRSYRR